MIPKENSRGEKEQKGFKDHCFLLFHAIHNTDDAMMGNELVN